MTHNILDLDDLDRIQTRCKQLNLDLSEFSFANLFLFRREHQHRLCEIEKRLYVYGVNYDKKKYYMPLYDISDEDVEFLQSLLSSVDMIYPVPQPWAFKLQEKGCFASYSEADSDYIFSLHDIQTYHGRHRASRRNLATQCRSLYQIEKASLQSAQEMAFSLLNTWAEHEQQHADVEPCLEAIRLYSQLGLQGSVYSVDKKPVGLIISEQITSSTCVLHFAKADVRYKGIYQYMYQEYACALPSSCLYLNWEQDMGMPGLRQSKKSYIPHHMLHKMRITFHAPHSSV